MSDILNLLNTMDKTQLNNTVNKLNNILSSKDKEKLIKIIQDSKKFN